MNNKKQQQISRFFNSSYICLGLFILGFLCTQQTNAQSLTAQKQKFYNGQYEEVFPYFTEKFKSYPNSANYNFFYGACCAHVGQLEKSLKPLEYAVKRQTPPAYEHLIWAYKELYRFDDAEAIADKWLIFLLEKRQNTEIASQIKEDVAQKALMLRGISKITILDSIVIDKNKFLTAYALPESAGFLNQINDKEVRYTPQIESQQWYAAQDLITRKVSEDSTITTPVFKIMVRHREGDTWGTPKAVSESVNTNDGDSNYPYLMSDGQTLYFANNGSKSIGGYDIFVTRRMTEEGEFLKPQNMGMPFNSPANDYMLVIDTSHKLGWFASDRYQPNGMVCVYTFVPNETREVYDSEKFSKKLLANFASLCPISVCRPDKKEYEEGIKRLDLVRKQIISDKERGNMAFTFVLDDAHTYHQYSEFNNPSARKLFKQYETELADYTKLNKRLQSLRDSYAITVNSDQKHTLRQNILALEDTLPKMKEKLSIQTKKIRLLEKK